MKNHVFSSKGCFSEKKSPRQGCYSWVCLHNLRTQTKRNPKRNRQKHRGCSWPGRSQRCAKSRHRQCERYVSISIRIPRADSGIVMVDGGLIFGFLLIFNGFCWKWGFWCIPSSVFCVVQPCRVFFSEKHSFSEKHWFLRIFKLFFIKMELICYQLEEPLSKPASWPL